MLPERGRRLVVDVDRAASVRAEVGPMAWFVLQAIAERCPPGRPVAEVEINTRHLAEAVALSKDTVGRAIRILTASGLVRRIDRRDMRTGRFVAAIYVVDLAAAGLELVDSSDGEDRVAAVRSSRRAALPPCPTPAAATDGSWTQLGLLP